MLINYSLGPTKLSPHKPFISEKLGEDGIDKYKRVIDSNNITLRKVFFEDPFINRLWPFLRETTRELCFRNEP